MMNMKGIVFLFVLSAFITCSSSSDKEQGTDDGSWYVTVEGKVLNPQSGRIEINEITDSGTGWTDTISLRSDQTFTKKVKLKEPGYYRLNFFDKQIVNVILFKSDVEVTVDGGDMYGLSEVKGSPEIDFVMKANKLLQDVQSSPEIQKLNERFEEARKLADQEKMVALQQEYQRLASIKQRELAELIKNEPPSLGVINLLQNNVLDKDNFFDVYAAVAEKLKKEWPDYSHAVRFVEMVEAMQSTAIGQKAPEIALPNPDGDIVKLSSLQGNYVLVDFWAKWCGPCRVENPNVVRVFHKYKDKGFTVFGVSLDRTREDWIKAIEDDNLTWTHVSDLKFWQSEAAKTYNINAIPFSLLLDPNGVIIAKNLRGPALEKKLEEIFKK